MDDSDTLFVFAGVDGAMAYTVDEAGANLPEGYGPWTLVRPVSTSDPTFKAGRDKAALEDVRTQGFSVSIFSVTFEPLTTIPERY